MPRPHRTPDPQTAYVAAFSRALSRLLTSVRNAADRDDIVQAEALTLWRKIDRVMAAYSDPAVYAATRVRHGAIQWDRRQGSQRGQGSRYVTNPDGTTSPGRVVVSGNVAIGADDGTELFAVIGPSDPTAVDDTIVDSLDGQALLEGCLLGISEADREVLYLVDGHGMSVTEVALIFGVSRETMSRRVSKLRSLTRRNATMMVAQGRTDREVIAT